MELSLSALEQVGFPRDIVSRVVRNESMDEEMSFALIGLLLLCSYSATAFSDPGIIKRQVGVIYV